MKRKQQQRGQAVKRGGKEDAKLIDLMCVCVRVRVCVCVCVCTNVSLSP